MEKLVGQLASQVGQRARLPRYGNFVGAGWSGGSATPTVHDMISTPPIDVLDAIAKEHDLLYFVATTQSDVRYADTLFIQRVEDAERRHMFQSWREAAVAKVAKAVLQAKRYVEGKLPLYGVDTRTLEVQRLRVQMYLTDMSAKGGIVEDFWLRKAHQGWKT